MLLGMGVNGQCLTLMVCRAQLWTPPSMVRSVPKGLKIRTGKSEKKNLLRVNIGSRRCHALLTYCNADARGNMVLLVGMLLPHQWAVGQRHMGQTQLLSLPKCPACDGLARVM